jgi:hypothetical protein
MSLPLACKRTLGVISLQTDPDFRLRPIFSSEPKANKRCHNAGEPAGRHPAQTATRRDVNGGRKPTTHTGDRRSTSAKAPGHPRAAAARPCPGPPRAAVEAQLEKAPHPRRAAGGGGNTVTAPRPPKPPGLEPPGKQRQRQRSHQSHRGARHPKEQQRWSH